MTVDGLAMTASRVRPGRGQSGGELRGDIDRRVDPDCASPEPNGNECPRQETPLRY